MYKSISCISFAILMVSGYAFAETAEEDLVGFVEKVVQYPVQTTQNLAGATSEAINKTSEGLEETSETATEVLQGDISKAPEIVEEATTNAVETSIDLVEDTAKAPIDTN